MKNKLISVSIILMLIFMSLISVEAIAPTPKIELDEYQITLTDPNSGVSIRGTVNICKGQMVGVYDSLGNNLYAYTTVGDTGKSGSFKVQIPALYIKEGKNTFKVKSLPLRGIINGSNPKTITVSLNSSKLDQTITASNLTLKVNEKKNLNAKVNSGLPLTYISANPNVATVDTNGTVIGRAKGTTKVTISQAGNDKYKPASIVVTITVNASSTQPTKDEITTSFDAYQFSKTGQSKSLGAKAKNGSALTYKSTNTNIATVDSKGSVTGKKPGIAKIRISLKNNSSCYKDVTIYVPRTPNTRLQALKPWYNAMEAQKKAQNKRPAIYNWSKWHGTGYSLSGSEKYGTCITFPSASLQRAGLLKKGEYVTAQDGKNFNGGLKRTSKKFLKRHPGYFTSYDNNTSLKKAVSKGKILPGDIIHYKYHTLVYWGKEKGNLYISEAGRWKSKKYNYAHIKVKTSGKTKVGWINRINCYNITTTCINGKISDSNFYMAGQNIKVNYTPTSGKKISSIKVDGKVVSVNQNKSNYTFKNLNKNHTIEVIYN